MLAEHWQAYRSMSPGGRAWVTFLGVGVVIDGLAFLTLIYAEAMLPDGATSWDVPVTGDALAFGAEFVATLPAGLVDAMSFVLMPAIVLTAVAGMFVWAGLIVAAGIGAVSAVGELFDRAQG